ncbi:MAG: hypothetical protein IOD12_05340 [Silvanigrellales bacterium]|nr:hypothetical protein [Silvanigrellales bacterium]
MAQATKFSKRAPGARSLSQTGRTGGHKAATRAVATLVTTAALAALFSLHTACGLLESDARKKAGTQEPLPGARMPAPEGERQNVTLSLAVGADAGSFVAALPRHDTHEIEVKYVDSPETAPYFGRVRGALEAGRTLSVGAVRTLPKVRVSVNLFAGSELVALCETSLLDLSAGKATTLEARLVCTPATVASKDNGTVDSGKPITLPIVAITRNTKDLGLTPEFRNATEDLLTRAREGLLFLNTAVTFDDGRSQRASRAELAYLPAEQTSQTSASRQNGTLQLRFVETSSQAMLLHLASGALSVEALKGLLDGEGTVQIDGRLLARVSTGNATSSEYVDATLNLSAREAQGARIVTDGKTRALRVSLEAHFTSIDGVSVAKGSLPSLPLDFVLRDATSKTPAEISVGSYNVENMWDDSEAKGVHYEDYSSATSNWYADKIYLPKARSVAKAIALAGAPDILALEEIESGLNTSRSLELLKPELAKLGYRYFELGHQQDDNPVAVTTALVSKFPIVQSFNLPFVFKDEAADARMAEELAGSSRDPHVSEVVVGGRILRVYSAHWKSKRSGDAIGDRMRLFTGQLIKADMDAARKASPLLDMVVLGDFNTDYTDKAVVEGLRSTGDETRMLQTAPSDDLYNLWFELPEQERCSYSFDGKRTCIDNILVNDALFDDVGFQIVDNSFRVVGHKGLPREILLNADGTPLRSQLTKSKVGSGPLVTKHLAVGYSDHLPLVFTLKLMGVSNSGDSKKGITKATRVNPSTTHLGSNTLNEDVVPVCTDAEPTLDVRLEDVFLPQNFGRCINIQGVALPLRRVGDRDTGVVLTEGPAAGRTLIVGATRSYGANRSWIAQTLSPLAGAGNLTAVKGRIGFFAGRLAVLPHDVATDITLVPFVKCGSLADVKASLVDVLPSAFEANKLSCVSVDGATVEIKDGALPAADASGTPNKINVGLLTPANGMASLALRMNTDEARRLFPSPGRYLVEGFGALDHFAPRNEWQVNLVAFGLKTGALLTAVPKAD